MVVVFGESAWERSVGAVWTGSAVVTGAARVAVARRKRARLPCSIFESCMAGLSEVGAGMLMIRLE